MIRLQDILCESTNLSFGAKTSRFIVRPQLMDERSLKMESEFHRFFDSSDHLYMLRLFYNGNIRRFMVEWNSSEEGLDGGYWGDPQDIDDSGRKFIKENISPSDLVHIMNIYIRNIDKMEVGDEWKSSRRQSRIWKQIFLQHFKKTYLQGFGSFDEMLKGMANIMAGRYKDFIAPCNMIEISTLPL